MDEAEIKAAMKSLAQRLQEHLDPHHSMGLAWERIVLLIQEIATHPAPVFLRQAQKAAAAAAEAPPAAAPAPVETAPAAPAEATHEPPAAHQ